MAVDIENPGGSSAALKQALGALGPSFDLVGTVMTVNNLFVAPGHLEIYPNFKTLTEIILPDLTTIAGDFSISGSALTRISMPNLVAIWGFVVLLDGPLLTSLEVPKLASIGRSFSPSGLTSLPTIDLSALVSVDNAIAASGCDAVTTFTLSSALKHVGGNVVLGDCPLIEASVDNILVTLAALDGTNGTTSYNSHIVSLVGGAPPSATGLAAKVTLEGRGNTVTVN